MSGLNAAIEESVGFEPGAPGELADATLEVEDYSDETAGEMDETAGAAVEETPPAPLSRLEEAALKQGWVPQDRYAGDPAKWKPAEEWLLGTQERLEKRLAKLEEKNKKLADRVSKVHKSTAQEQLEAAKKQFRNAVQEGDDEEAERLRKDLSRYELEVESESEMETDESNPEVAPAIAEWMTRNSWFQKDPDLTEIAMAVNDRCVAKRMSNDQILKEVDKAIAPHLKARGNMNQNANTHPSRPAPAGNPRQPNAVGAGHSVPSKGTLYNSLPSDAKAACESDFRDPDIKEFYKGNRDAWAQAYRESEA